MGTKLLLVKITGSLLRLHLTQMKLEVIHMKLGVTMKTAEVIVMKVMKKIIVITFLLILIIHY